MIFFLKSHLSYQTCIYAACLMANEELFITKKKNDKVSYPLMFDDKLHILSMTQYQNDDVTTLPSNVVCVFPVMPLFVCLSAVQHGYVGQEVHNLIRNQNKNVTTAIVATVTISTTNRV